MKSSWDYTVSTSKYHFNTGAMDPRWDTVIQIGKIEPTWLDDLPGIIENSKPATWSNRGYKGEGVHIPSVDLEAEEYDLERVGMDPKSIITHLNWKIPDSLQKVSDKFALKDCMNRIHVQYPGQVWNLHIDKLQKWAPENPDSVIRIMIQLTDWQPGQFWEFGNFHWNRWSAGDVSTFDWQNVPHSTANAGHHPRVTFQLTGVITPETRKYIHSIA